MADLTTSDRLEAAEQLSGASAEEIGWLLGAASSMAEQFCHRLFISGVGAAVANEVHDGTGENSLFVHFTPLTAVTSIDIREPDDTWTTITETTPVTKFYFNVRIGEIRISPNALENYGHFPAGFQNIRVTYTGGYATADRIPGAVQQAVVAIAVALHQQAAAGGMVTAEKLGDYEVRLATAVGDGVPMIARKLLAPFMRYDRAP